MLINSENISIIKRFFLTVFMLTACAVLVSATQYAGDKTQLQLEGKGFPTVSAETLKNSCIMLFGMLK